MDRQATRRWGMSLLGLSFKGTIHKGLLKWTIFYIAAMTMMACSLKEYVTQIMQTVLYILNCNGKGTNIHRRITLSSGYANTSI